jgi:transcriptional regulator with XRE-family HTH domain
VHQQIQSPEARKDSKLLTEHLRNYIRRRLKEKGTLGQTAAAAIGVSSNYFSRVATGKVERPGASFCVKLAEFFGDSHITVLRLAGWLPETETDEALVQEMCELTRTDPYFKDLTRIYRGVTSEELKYILLAMATALVKVWPSIISRRKPSASSEGSVTAEKGNT